MNFLLQKYNISKIKKDTNKFLKIIKSINN